MKKTIRKTLRKHKRVFENMAVVLADADYTEIGLEQKQYLENLLATNEKLLKINNINNLILF